ncbi:hypothetical protein ACO1D2_11655 [Bacillus thuringiensis]|uniref:hypothetical protein n=1 Tax=Bacillus thuringiensis TaxID=1428 RepID=UPI003BF6BC4E
MAFRTKEVKTYTTYVICDDCGKEMVLCTTFNPPSFDTKMNGALSAGYTFKDTGKQFKNYCSDCKGKHEVLKTVIKGFLEDYDGLIVLSDIRNFKDEKEFVEQAEKYIVENRGYRIPVLQPQVTDIIVGDEEWKPADDPDIEGEKITVYCSDLDWESSEEN